MKKISYILASILEICLLAASWHWPRLSRRSKPLRAILEECEEMVKVYMQSPLGRDGTKRKLRGLLDAGWEKIQGVDLGDTYKCCVNTELNSTNFLVDDKGGPSHLIDWEKPICGIRPRTWDIFSLPRLHFGKRM